MKRSTLCIPVQTTSLSAHLDIARKRLEKAGVFDSTLGIDTKLFVDPKLLIKSKIPEFKDARADIIRYFADLIRILKQSHKSERLQKLAISRLAVPEPAGLSIGFGDTTDRGMAISQSVAKKILLSLSEVLAVGIDDEELVELMGLFVDGFGPDSMSDLTVSIIYPRFCAYTQRVAKELGVKTTRYTIRGAKYRLPTHPFKNTQIIFVPHSLLRPLPLAVSWDEIAAASEHNRRLREEYDKIVFPALKEAVIEAKETNESDRESMRKGFNALLELYRRISVKSYNLRTDEKGYYALQPFVQTHADEISASRKPTNPQELVAAVRDLAEQFRRAIEDNGGNRLLYKRTGIRKILKDKPHHEDVAQSLFYMIADIYCQQADILLSREPNAGRGPVDFSLGTGRKNKVVVEIKKSNNKELENGYNKQLRAYQKAEAAHHAFYIVIVVKEDNRKPDDPETQLERIQKIAIAEEKSGLKAPEIVVIDGLIYPSASKLRN